MNTSISRTRRVRNFSRAIGSCVVAGLLGIASACGPSAEKPADSAAEAVTPAPAPETPATSDVPGTHLTEHGYGALKVGMTFAEANDSLKGALRAGDRADLAGCDYVNWTGGPKGLLVMVVANRIARVETTDSSITTAAGAHVGDSETRVNSLYQGRVTVLPHKYTDGHYLVVKPANPADTLHLIVFETNEGKVTALRGGMKPAVEYVEGCS